MAEIILVRHGQANSKAKDEASYDRLSDLGRIQAGWLGERFRATNGHFDQVISGTLNRQVHTAEAIGVTAPHTQDSRWNEMEYYTMSLAFEAQHGEPFPQTQHDYTGHAPRLFRAWFEDRISDIPEAFSAFENRVMAALDEAAAPGGRVLIVTSGGVIAAVIRRLLGLDATGMAKVMLHTANSSAHRVEVIDGRPYLDGFNDLSHVDAPDRAHARTYI